MKLRKINLVNNCLLVIVLINNLAGHLFKNDDYSSSIIVLFCLLIVSSVISIIKNKKLTGTLYLLGGIAMTFLGAQGNTGGITLLLFSIHLFDRGLNSIYVIAIITILTVLIKSAINGYNILEAFNMMILYAGFFAIYYYMFDHKEK